MTNQTYKSEERLALRWVFMGIAILFLVAFFAWFCNRSVQVVDTGIVRYEEFHEIARTTEKLNTDLCQMRALPDTDKMFEQFSKAQRINAIQAQLNRWIEEYNAKSRMINRSLWKSAELPYQLNTNQFNCYGGN
jgi:hypothetical protein